MKLVAKYAIAPSAMSTTTTTAIQMGAPERKATRELVKPGGLSGELPAGDTGSVHPLERNHHPSQAQKWYN
jgi:hypothetical protein